MLISPAASAMEAEAPAPVETVSDAYVTVETFTPGGVLVASKTYGMATMGKTLDLPGLDRIPDVARAAGEDATAYTSGNNTGMQAPTGCGTATVHNRESTVGGGLAWDIDITTYWCWNNSQGRIYNISNGWRIHEMDAMYAWRGWLQGSPVLGFYSWRDGQPQSGYSHWRQGHVENCVINWSCIGSYYPKSEIRAHSNGSFWWMADR